MSKTGTSVAFSAPPSAAVSHRRPPPPAAKAWVAPLRGLLGSPRDTLLTLLTLAALGLAVPEVLRWGLFDSVWVAGSAEVCKAAKGACWAVIENRWRLIFFGIYPVAQQWRPLLALGAIAAASAVTLGIGPKRPRLVGALWVGTLAAFIVLMGGGVAGLPAVVSDDWGGVPVTIFVFLCSVILGFPIAIALAIARTGRLVSGRIVSTALIEVIRPLPLITVLFCADLVLPMALPEVLNPGKLGRVILSMGVFYACYQAEIIRGGFRAVPRGHLEAAKALGLKASQTMWLIILPQALRATIPATVNLLVVALKDTSLIVIIGVFDFLAGANASFSGNEWQPYFDEVYIVVAIVYLAMTLTLTQLGRACERALPQNG